MNPPVADELCILASNPYDAGQRALWHVDRIGSIIDCRKTKLGEDLELLYAVPQKERSFARSSSAEEFGIYGDGLSPGDTGGKETRSRYLRVSENTRMKFLNRNSVVIFSLDLSPSMNVVDTSFKSVTTGCHLLESLVNSLRRVLRCLVSPITFPVRPEIYVSVVAHGIPSYGVLPLVVGELLTDTTVDQVVDKVMLELKKGIDELSFWLQANYTKELVSGAHSCSRTRNACSSPVCRASDFTTVVRDCLTSISMTCSQLSLGKAGVNKSIFVLTDGVLAHPRNLPYDNILMHLNMVDVALHIIQIGGGFAPWSALGYASDPDLLRLLAASTPTGLFLQDHHLDPILAGDSVSSNSILRPVPDIVANIIWMAATLKFSPLNCGLKSSRTSSHMPYMALTYQSSVLVKAGASARQEHTYFSLIEQSAIKRQERGIQLHGIDPRGPTGPQRSSEELAMQGSGRRNSFIWSEESDDNEQDQESAGPVVQSLKSYLEPERAKARPFLYRQYKLPGVSVAQVVELRCKEGFLIDSATATARKCGIVAIGQSPVIHRTGSTLSRASSATSLQASPSNATLDVNSSPRKQIALRLTWGPVMEVIYEIGFAGDEENQEEVSAFSFIARQAEEVRVKIFLQMPSGEFFLRFKQQLAAPSGDTNLWQMCRQLDALIESIFSVDDTLTKLTCPGGSRVFFSKSNLRVNSDPKIATQSNSLERIYENTNDLDEQIKILNRYIPGEVSSWHRWFAVRNLFLILDVSHDLQAQRIRHGLAQNLLEAARERLVIDLRTLPGSLELQEGRRFFVKISEWDEIKSFVLTQSHTLNILCASNENVSTKINGGDPRSCHGVTDPINPFMLIDLAESDPSMGVVRLNIAFFASCSLLQRTAIDSLSHKLASSKALLVDAPSPILRFLFQRCSVKPPLSSAIKPASALVGMGAGESFFTYDPNETIFNRFLTHLVWETACPPASVPADVLTSIHERRLKQGWKCVLEAHNCVQYVSIHSLDTQTAPLSRSRYPVRDRSRHWIPDEPDDSRRIKPNPSHTGFSEVLVDWGEFKPSASQSSPVSRNSIRGLCMCLSVQHVQVRGEKPIIRCELWADKGHPALLGKTCEQIQQYTEELCSFQSSQTPVA